LEQVEVRQVQQESQILSMDRNTPEIVIEGMEDIIKMDLDKHKGLLVQTKLDLAAFREAKGHESRKRIHYKNLVKDGKYNKAAMERAIEQCVINIRHLGDKAKLAQEKIQHHDMIVAELEVGLANQMLGLKHLEAQRNGFAN